MSSTTNISRFSDILDIINDKRKVMEKKNTLFKTIKDTTLSLEKRMSFVPYMLFFSCGCPDVMTLVMRIDKPDSHLTPIERKINAFVNEDNFHYNFYLNDLESLGYTIEKFSSTSGVIRHVFSEESISARKLIYNLSRNIRSASDPIVVLTITELLEAGLYDLFTNIYKHIVKSGEAFDHLEYFGDKHVLLEQNHTVTSWFGNKDEIIEDVSSYPVPEKCKDEIFRIINETMDDFNNMYIAFDSIIKYNDNISKEKYAITGTPPIDKITQNIELI